MTAMPENLDDRRRVPVTDGQLAWLFPGVADEATIDEIGGLLRIADELLIRIEQLLPNPTRGPVWSLAYRLTYCRLGPEPDYPITDLFAEGWSDDLHVLIRTWSDRATALGCQDGPWHVSACLTLTCDVDPRGCTGHVNDEWDRTGIAQPVEAARQTLAAAQWVHGVISTDSIDLMRSKDRQRAHVALPRRAD